ncbi:MAG TPA: sigma 54-interacting transcriptional regulator [Pirellulaceae bacterium]|nr:sigma 54-interacting transcriptional regulator [Pirellulaceae bacterium]
MNLITSSERKFIEPIAQLTYINPFLPARVELEKRILGRDYRPSVGGAWSLKTDNSVSSNIPNLQQRIESLADSLRTRLADGVRGTDRDHELYDDLVIHLLFLRADALWREVSDVQSSAPTVWKSFRQDFRHYLQCGEITFPSASNPSHLFAGIFQFHRAFQQIYRNVIGRSAASIALRAAIWHSIFTHDVRRYRRSLYDHMSHWATLIVGPSGTGKELVAQAIGRSQYIPFDSRQQRFAVDSATCFYPLHLAALPTALVESELFGHAQGAFTGADRERVGWLEVAGRFGSVFLDEIGEIESAVQVKLLRVLQTRQFSRIGEPTPRRFDGKMIAATNRDLLAEIERGSFRQDLYFRLCSDVIRTPTLREQLDNSPGELESSVRFIAAQLAADEVETVTADVMIWLGQHMPSGYAWPGNFRELEQCVRNIVVRNAYEFTAPRSLAETSPLAGTESAMEMLSLTSDQLLRRYCTYAYWKTGSYEQAAEQLKLDRRTVRAKIDADWLAQWSKSFDNKRSFRRNGL